MRLGVPPESKCAPEQSLLSKPRAFLHTEVAEKHSGWAQSPRRPPSSVAMPGIPSLLEALAEAG